MLEIIKDTCLSIAGLPKEIDSDIVEHSEYTLILVNGSFHNERSYSLPGGVHMSNRAVDFKVFGIKTPERKVLIVVDESIEESISLEDLNYYADLEDFTFYDKMRHKDIEPEGLFKPIEVLLSASPVRDHGFMVEYKSQMNNRNVFVRKNSNRHKFITGKSNFFDDPSDFYSTIDSTLKADNIQHYADIRDVCGEEYIYLQAEKDLIKTYSTLFSNSNMVEVAKKAVALRKKGVKLRITEDDYWEEFDVPEEPRLRTFSEIDFERIELLLPEIHRTQDDFYSLVHCFLVMPEVDKYGPFYFHVFITLFKFMEQKQFDYLVSAFNLDK